MSEHIEVNVTERPKPMAMCCGTPMVSTLIFSSAELFCVKCHQPVGLFHAPDEATATPELIAEHDRNKRWFLEVSAPCINDRARFRDCEQCESGEHGYHIDHASKEDILASQKAYLRLRNDSPPWLQGEQATPAEVEPDVLPDCTCSALHGEAHKDSCARTGGVK